MNDNVSAEQVKILRGEFETYLRKRNPHWSNFTVIIVNSDAFFALNNPVDVDFWSIFTSEESLIAGRDSIEKYLLSTNRPGSPHDRANGYLYALRQLKAFLDLKHPEYITPYKEISVINNQPLCFPQTQENLSINKDLFKPGLNKIDAPPNSDNQTELHITVLNGNATNIEYDDGLNFYDDANEDDDKDVGANFTEASIEANNEDKIARLLSEIFPDRKNEANTENYEDRLAFGKLSATSDDKQKIVPEMASTLSSSLRNIVDLEEGKAGIREIIETHFQTLYGYSNINILWNAVQDNLSLFLNDNAINTSYELWSFICRAFFGEYVMSNPHIWKTEPNYPKSYVGVIINLARQLGGVVSREQIDEYFALIKQRSLINRAIIQQELLLFYAPKQFMLTEAVDLTSERCAAIEQSLDRLFEQENVSYIIPRDISAEWFSSLPAIKGGFKWTALLLQEVLRLRPIIGYSTVFSGLYGQDLDTLGASIVPNKSEINKFSDVVHRHCYEKGLLGKRIVSEELRIILRDAGMLEGNELIYNLHKALRDYRFAFTDENRMVKILER